MRSVVWKFVLVAGYQTITMPVGAKILAVREQHNQACMWALCSSTEYEEREFSMIGTGLPFDASHYDYLGTVQLAGGAFIGHVFEREAS